MSNTVDPLFLHAQNVANGVTTADYTETWVAAQCGASQPMTWQLEHLVGIKNVTLSGLRVAVRRCG